MDQSGRDAQIGVIGRMFAASSASAVRAASDEMYEGTTKRPFYPEEHAAIILVASRKFEFGRYTPKFSGGGERTFDCRYCCDFGTVGVRGRDGRVVWKACVCDRAKKYSERREFLEAESPGGIQLGPISKFDPSAEQVISTLGPSPRSKSLWEATPAEREEARSVLADCKAAVTAALTAADDSSLGSRP
jgi:hypothetical protein